MSEFEDAMKGEFKEFLNSFPIVELKADERVAGGLVFRVKADPPQEEWEPTKYTVQVREGKDLWRVCHKSKWARLCIPKLEFEVQADGQRHIDSLYNHIGTAITNLAVHCSSSRSGALGNHSLFCALVAGHTSSATVHMVLAIYRVQISLSRGARSADFARAQAVS
jgi:hypothetical protein